jgi:RNA polymerase sigma-70 factor (ECF subfamily)
MNGKPSPVQDPHEWIRAAVTRFEGPLTLYATRLLGDADRARDVVQDAFLKLCRQDAADLQDRLAEWLFTVCRNRALDVLRKEGRMTRLSDEHSGAYASPDPGPAEAVETRDSAEQVLSALENLPQSQREVIRLKFQNGFSYREISRISGHSVTNVGFLIHTGLKTIRRRLVDDVQPLRAQA